MKLNKTKYILENNINLFQLKEDKQKILKYFKKQSSILSINEYQIFHIKNTNRTYLVTTSINNNIVILNKTEKQTDLEILNALFNINIEKNKNQFINIFNGITKAKSIYIDNNNISTEKDENYWTNFNNILVNVIEEI